jgi:uncharacterized lipoprotein YmbA
MKSNTLLSKVSQIVPCGLLFAALSAGCTVFPDSPAAKLYSLDLPPMSVLKTCPVKFAVREVTLPGYLNRPEVVLGGDSYQVRASALHLWAAPLGVELTRLTAQGLQEILGGSQAMPYPVRQFERPDWVLSIDLKRINLGSNTASMEISARGYRMSSSSKESSPATNSTLGPWNFQQSTDYPALNPQENSATSGSIQASAVARSLSVALGKTIQSLGQEFGKVVCP